MKVQGVPQELEIDTQLIDHVVSNLLSNALKYSPGAKAPEVNLSFNKLSRVTLRVKDHGIGIPKKDQRSLFESFYRATNVKNIQGSGLGLSIVKEFTEMHGGTIEVDSDEGKGSEFIVELPLS
jgi:signal transduction histidine kinase